MLSTRCCVSEALLQLRETTLLCDRGPLVHQHRCCAECMAQLLPNACRAQPLLLLLPLLLLAAVPSTQSGAGQGLLPAACCCLTSPRTPPHTPPAHECGCSCLFAFVPQHRHSQTCPCACAAHSPAPGDWSWSAGAASWGGWRQSSMSKTRLRVGEWSGQAVVPCWLGWCVWTERHKLTVIEVGHPALARCGHPAVRWGLGTEVCCCCPSHRSLCRLSAAVLALGQ